MIEEYWAGTDTQDWEAGIHKYSGCIKISSLFHLYCLVLAGAGPRQEGYPLGTVYNEMNELGISVYIEPYYLE